MAKPKRVQISEHYGEYEIGFQELINIVERFSELEDPSFDFYDDYGCYKIVFTGWRPENEKERAKRLADNKKQKLAKLQEKVEQESKEKEQLSTLLLKYHGILPEELNGWPT